MKYLSISKFLIFGVLVLQLYSVSIDAGVNIYQSPIEELTKLLGHRIYDEVVQSFVINHRLEKFAKGGSGSYGHSNGSFSLLFREGIINRIIIHLKPVEGVTTSYKGALPYEANVSDSPDDIRKRMGGAPKKDEVNYDGDGWLVYERFDFRVTFAFSRKKMEKVYLDQIKNQ